MTESVQRSKHSAILAIAATRLLLAKNVQSSGQIRIILTFSRRFGVSVHDVRLNAFALQGLTVRSQQPMGGKPNHPFAFEREQGLYGAGPKASPANDCGPMFILDFAGNDIGSGSGVLLIRTTIGLPSVRSPQMLPSFR
jgi:hypothetical protein